MQHKSFWLFEQAPESVIEKAEGVTLDIFKSFWLFEQVPESVIVDLPSMADSYLSTLRNLKQGDFIWFRVHSLRRGVRGPPRPPNAQGFQVFSEGIPAVSWYIH